MSALRQLRRLREIMGGSSESPQEKLHNIVRLIATEMGAESSSLYILQGPVYLRLLATYGLNTAQVGHVRLKVGEGVIGLTAAKRRTIQLRNIQTHPNFKPIKELGEDQYHAFLGVPLIRDGALMGVLAIQSKTKRAFSSEEMEIIENVAMVLAEMLVATGLVRPQTFFPLGGAESFSSKQKGISLNSGLAMAPCVLHHPIRHVQKVIADDIDGELTRFEKALHEMWLSVRQMLESQEQGSDSREVIEVYELFAHDRGWAEKIRALIQGGLTAEAAVGRVHRDMQARLVSVNDRYLRERLTDFEDLSNRLLVHLQGSDKLPIPKTEEGIVIVARSMGAAELLDYDQHNIKGLVLEAGIHTAHVAIVARALNIPVVARLPNILAHVKPGEKIIVDGDNATVTLNPTGIVKQEYELRAQFRRLRCLKAKEKQHLPATTKDGIQVHLNVNIGLVHEMRFFPSLNVEGVGLYRTEIPFMLEEEFPSVEKQTQIYGEVIERAEGKPVVFRTLDIGGDKDLPYLAGVGGENPALGWRAIRIGLDRPMILRQQIRAILKAGAGHDIVIMFPMIGDVPDLMEAKKILWLEQQRQQARGEVQPRSLKVGIMVEVPSAAWCLDELIKHVDFLSVGSNDMFQFFRAIDRGNPFLMARYDCLSPSFLKFLRQIVATANAHNKPITICGEMAGNPVEAMALMLIGFRHLSLSPGAVASIRQLVRSISLNQMQHYFGNIIDSPKSSVRDDLVIYARDHEIIT